MPRDHIKFDLVTERLILKKWNKSLHKFQWKKKCRKEDLKGNSFGDVLGNQLYRRHLWKEEGKHRSSQGILELHPSWARWVDSWPGIWQGFLWLLRQNREGGASETERATMGISTLGTWRIKLPCPQVLYPLPAPEKSVSTISLVYNRPSK